MKDFKEKREANRILKDLVLDKLRDGPLYFAEIKEIFNLKKDNLSNILISLKYFELIETYHKDLTAAPNKRRWVAVKDAMTFEEKLKQVEKHNREKAEEQISPLASRVVNSNMYHTHGSKGKLSAWQGYTSF